MYCQQCGGELAAGVSQCPECHHPVGKVPDAVGRATEEARQAAAAAGAAFRLFVMNPVGGLSTAYKSIGEQRSAAAGVALGIISSLLLATGMFLVQRRAARGLDLFFVAPPGFSAFLKLVLVSVVAVGVLGITVLVLKTAFGGSRGASGSLFTAGAGTSYLGLLFILAGILGLKNVEVILLLGVFAMCYVTLILYTGFTQILSIHEGRAAFMLPVTLLLSAWLAKVIYVAVF